MFSKLTKLGGGAIVGLGLLIGTASAQQTYNVVDAVNPSDPVDHSLWLNWSSNSDWNNFITNLNATLTKNIINEFSFTGSGGVLTLDPNASFTGTGSLTGTVVNKGNSAFGFDVDVSFTQLDPAGVTPKFEKPGIQPSEAVAKDIWSFWGFEGTLTGTGDFTGLNLTIIQKPGGDVMPFQWGVAANNKNALLGGSGWLYSVGLNNDASTMDFVNTYLSPNRTMTFADPNNLRAADLLHGDFNLQVPEPGTWIMMILGVGLLGFWSRRR